MARFWLRFRRWLWRMQEPWQAGDMGPLHNDYAAWRRWRDKEPSNG